MKNLIYIFIFLLIALTSKINAKYDKIFIDTVISFQKGTGQNLGQDSQYYPNNIFGLPDTIANSEVPASAENKVLSLGMGGEIIVSFKNYYIENGEGSDFTIFENAFYSPITEKIFCEPAVVSVSFDGIEYYEFPFDSLTLKGCAGITPTNGNKDPYNCEESGGDCFDLEDLGLSKIKYIKIKDVSEFVKKNKNHPFYDPIISGFDLDAIVSNYGVSETSANNSYIDNTEENYTIYHKHNNISISCNNLSNNIIRIYSLAGNLLKTYEFNNSLSVNLLEFPRSIILIQILSDKSNKILKINNVY